MLGTVRVGRRPERRKEYSHRGRARACGASRTIDLMFIDSGMTGLPQSRPWENDQSRVAMSPTAPAARARSMRATIWSRLPTQ